MVCTPNLLDRELPDRVYYFDRVDSLEEPPYSQVKEHKKSLLNIKHIENIKSAKN